MQFTLVIFSTYTKLKQGYIALILTPLLFPFENYQLCSVYHKISTYSKNAPLNVHLLAKLAKCALLNAMQRYALLYVLFYSSTALISYDNALRINKKPLKAKENDNDKHQ